MAELAGLVGIGALLGLSFLFKDDKSSSILSNVESLTALEITQKILQKDFKTLSYKDYKQLETTPKEKDLEKSFIDHHKELKDLCTEMVVKLFLNTDECMFNFLHLVYESFTIALDEYKKHNKLDKWDIFFVYKGGNVLRIITNDFLKELPRVASKDIHKYYEKFFKRSDADFSIYIRPTLKDYNRIYKELTLLAYLLQVKIRHEFLSNPTKYFYFYQLSTEYQNQLLSAYVDTAKKARCFSDSNNPAYYGKSMDAITFCDAKYPNESSYSYEGAIDKGIQEKNADEVIMYQLNNTKNPIFIQANETLDFLAAGNKTKFTLVRSKLNFNFYINGKTTQIGGELIDVSLAHRDDSNLKHFFEHSNEYIRKYQLSFKDTSLNFYSYGLTYLIGDLEYILYQFVQLPWTTPKYEKRLNRLFYLYFIDLFVKIKGLDVKKKLLEKFQKNIFSVKLQEMKDIENLLSVVKKYNIKELEIGKLIDKLEAICKLMIQKELSGDISSFNEMMQVLNENCTFLLKAFTGIKEYCTEEGNIKMRILYDNEFSSLIGGKK